ncbi:BtpA/SgcQ family protein [Thermomicrobium sp.]
MSSRLLDSVPFLLVGVVHLLPLPGSPRATRDVARIRERACRDAEAYREGGAHALIVENFGDAPFRKDGVEPHVIALMAVIVEAVRVATGLPVGVNVLRNDARAALGIAAATGASFIRVNVHVGAMVTDQGIIEGRADETLRYRTLLQSETEIWADVLVKHAVPLAPLALEDAAQETVQRGLADALILTGPMTGRAPDPADLMRVRERLPATPVLVGSGVTADNVARYVHAARGAIVGTWTKVDGKTENPVDPARVRRLCEAISRALPHERHGPAS